MCAGSLEEATLSITLVLLEDLEALADHDLFERGGRDNGASDEPDPLARPQGRAIRVESQELVAALRARRIPLFYFSCHRGSDGWSFGIEGIGEASGTRTDVAQALLGLRGKDPDDDQALDEAREGLLDGISRHYSSQRLSAYDILTAAQTPPLSLNGPPRAATSQPDAADSSNPYLTDLPHVLPDLAPSPGSTEPATPQELPGWLLVPLLLATLGGGAWATWATAATRPILAIVVGGVTLLLACLAVWFSVWFCSRRQ